MRAFAHYGSLRTPQEYISIYPGELLVVRDRSPDRYNLGAGCEYDIPQMPSGKDSIQVFEHIGLRSGGTSYYDPSKLLSLEFAD